MVQWLACRTIPQNAGIALVGDADCHNGSCFDTGFCQGLDCDTKLALPVLFGVMLDPTRLWKVLSEFALRHGADVAIVIEQDGT